MSEQKDKLRESIAKIIFVRENDDKTHSAYQFDKVEQEAILQFIEPLIEEAKKEGERKALRRILRESKYLSPYELIDSIKQALKEEK